MGANRAEAGTLARVRRARYGDRVVAAVNKVPPNAGRVVER